MNEPKNTPSTSVAFERLAWYLLLKLAIGVAIVALASDLGVLS